MLWVSHQTHKHTLWRLVDLFYVNRSGVYPNLCALQRWVQKKWKFSCCNVNLKIARRTPVSQKRPCKLKLVGTADLCTDSDHVYRNAARILFPQHLDDNLMNVEHSVMWKFIGYDWSTQAKSCPIAILSTTNHTQTVLRLNQSLHVRTGWLIPWTLARPQHTNYAHIWCHESVTTLMIGCNKCQNTILSV